MPRALYDALKLTLMFHEQRPWTMEAVREWQRITGTEQATAEVLCDHIRKVLEPSL